MSEFPKEFDSLDASVRRQAFEAALPGLRPFNMHCHSFFSYNGYGYSPTHIAALAAKSGWRGRTTALPAAMSSPAGSLRWTRGTPPG